LIGSRRFFFLTTGYVFVTHPSASEIYITEDQKHVRNEQTTALKPMPGDGKPETRKIGNSVVSKISETPTKGIKSSYIPSVDVCFIRGTFH